MPKFLINEDGSLGERNDVHCVSIEHKLGIKASPTAVLQFGDHGGAIGHLIGEENRGLEYMFIMMNAARFAVGMQGGAYQKAVAYAKDRVQSRPVDGSVNQSVAIIQHPDVRRMLATMRGLTEVVDFVVENTKSDPNAVFAGSVPYLELAGIMLGGLANGARCSWPMPNATKIRRSTARRLRPRSSTRNMCCRRPRRWKRRSSKGDESVLALSEDQF